MILNVDLLIGVSDQKMLTRVVLEGIDQQCELEHLLYEQI